MRTSSRPTESSAVRHGHSRQPSEVADQRRLVIALALIVSFMAGEAVVGLRENSLALLADAAHMLTDAAALGLSIWALRLAARPPHGSYTYGLRRSETLSAQANGLTLLVLAGLVVYQGIMRLVDPPTTHGEAMLTVALIGIVVNLAATWQLRKARGQSMAVEGSFRHIVTDLVGFILTALAAAVILTAGWKRADGVAALLIAAVMLRTAYRLIRDSSRVLLEAAPPGTDPQRITRSLSRQPGVIGIRDLHVWELGGGFPALSAHVLVGAHADCHQIRRSLERLLRSQFDICHTTLQVDHQSDRLD